MAAVRVSRVVRAARAYTSGVAGANAIHQGFSSYHVAPGAKWLGDERPMFCKGCRSPDALVKTGDNMVVAHEVKVGCVRGVFANAQVRKDVALLRAGEFDGVVWHFFASETTGRIGPSAAFLKRLEDAGIDFYIHLPG